MSQTRYSPSIDNVIEEWSDSDGRLEDRYEKFSGNEDAEYLPYGEVNQDIIKEDSNGVSGTE